MAKKVTKGWLKRKMEKYPLLDNLVRTVVTLLLPSLLLADKFENGSKWWQFWGFVFAVFSWWVFEQEYPWYVMTPILIIDGCALIIAIDVIRRKYRKWKKKRTKT